MKVVLFTIGALVGVWAYAIFGIPAIPGLLLWLGVGIWLGRARRWRAFVPVAVASPFCVSAALGAVTYCSGTARLFTVGLPDVELHNVSPDSRLQAVSSGCIVNGGEWVRELPNNLVLVALTSVFGPMPGAYDGPYPSESDVDHALRSAGPLPLDMLRSDNVVVAGRSVRLRAKLGQELVEELLPSQLEQPATAALWRERVLIIRFTSSLADVSHERPLAALIDATSGKVFAYLGARRRSRLPRQWS